ncbi:hypothetical protein KEM54_005021, partial [Ascosphaera aggregata]
IKPDTKEIILHVVEAYDERIIQYFLHAIVYFQQLPPVEPVLLNMMEVYDTSGVHTEYFSDEFEACLCDAAHKVTAL